MIIAAEKGEGWKEERKQILVTKKKGGGGKAKLNADFYFLCSSSSYKTENFWHQNCIFLAGHAFLLNLFL